MVLMTAVEGLEDEEGLFRYLPQSLHRLIRESFSDLGDARECEYLSTYAISCRTLDISHVTATI